MSIKDINNAAAAMNQLKARYEGFLDEADGQIGVRQAAYDGLAADLKDVAKKEMSRRFYLSYLGSDANDGLTPETAKLSIDAVRAASAENAFLYLYIESDAENPFLVETVNLSNRGIEMRPLINGGQLYLKWRGNLVFQGSGYLRTLYNCHIDYDGDEYLGQMVTLSGAFLSLGGFNAVNITVKNDPNFLIARCSYSMGGFVAVYMGRVNLLNELGDPYDGVAVVLGTQSSAGLGSTELWQCSMGPNFVHLGTEIAPNKHIKG